MIIKFSYQDLLDRAKYKPTGYIDDIIEASEYDDINELYLLDTDSEEYKQLVLKYQQASATDVDIAVSRRMISSISKSEFKDIDNIVRYKSYLEYKKWQEDLKAAGIDLSPNVLIEKAPELVKFFKTNKFEYAVQQYKKANVKSDCKNCAEQVYINRLLWEFMQAYKRLPYKKQLEVIKLLRYEPEVIDVNPIEESSS